jgi:hypothetical protein
MSDDVRLGFQLAQKIRDEIIKATHANSADYTNVSPVWPECDEFSLQHRGRHFVVEVRELPA